MQMRKELDEVHGHRKACSDELIEMTGMLKKKVSDLITAEEAQLLDVWKPSHGDATPEQDSPAAAGAAAALSTGSADTEGLNQGELGDADNANNGMTADEENAGEGTAIKDGENSHQADMLPEVDEDDYAGVPSAHDEPMTDNWPGR